MLFSVLLYTSDLIYIFKNSFKYKIVRHIACHYNSILFQAPAAAAAGTEDCDDYSYIYIYTYVIHTRRIYVAQDVRI